MGQLQQKVMMDQAAQQQATPQVAQPLINPQAELSGAQNNLQA